MGFIKIFIYIGIRQILAIFKYSYWNGINNRLALPTWQAGPRYFYWTLLWVSLFVPGIHVHSLNLTTYMNIYI